MPYIQDTSGNGLGSVWVPDAPGGAGSYDQAAAQASMGGGGGPDLRNILAQQVAQGGQGAAFSPGGSGIAPEAQNAPASPAASPSGMPTYGVPMQSGGIMPIYGGMPGGGGYAPQQAYEAWLYGGGPGNAGFSGGDTGYGPGVAPGAPGPGNSGGGGGGGGGGKGGGGSSPSSSPFGDPTSFSTQGQVEAALGFNNQMNNLGVIAPGFFGVPAPNVQNSFNPSVQNPYGYVNPMNMENPFDGYLNSLYMGVDPSVMAALGYDTSGNGLGGGMGGGFGGGGGGFGGGYGFGIGPGPGGENSVGPNGEAGPY